VRTYNSAVRETSCRRLCRAHRLELNAAWSAGDVSPDAGPSRLSLSARATGMRFRPIYIGGGLRAATAERRNMRQGLHWASSERVESHRRIQQRLSRRKAPVLLAHVFVVIGNAGHETPAQARAFHGDTLPAQARMVARGEDMRRTSGNFLGLICGFAHGERPGTKTGATAIVADLSLPPSLEERAMGESLQKSLRFALLDGVSGRSASGRESRHVATRPSEEG
jgi:hypothetical protein